MQPGTGIRFRLNCIIGVLLFFSGLTIASITIFLSRDALEGQTRGKVLPAMVEKIAMSIEHQISASANTLKILGRSPLLLDWITKGEDRAQLPLLTGMSRDFMAIHKAAATYIELHDSLNIYETTPASEKITKLDPARDSWFFDFGKAGTLMSISIVDTKEPDHAWRVFINTRVEDADGRFLGQLATAFTAEDFIDRIRIMKIGEKGTSFVVQKNGDILLHPDAERIWTKLADLPGFAGLAEQALLQPEKSFTTTNGHGERIFVVGREIPLLNAIVFTQANADELVTHTGMAWAYSALAGLAALGIGLFLSDRLANFITRSLHHTSGRP